MATHIECQVNLDRSDKSLGVFSKASLLRYYSSGRVDPSRHALYNPRVKDRTCRRSANNIPGVLTQHATPQASPHFFKRVHVFCTFHGLLLPRNSLLNFLCAYLAGHYLTMFIMSFRVCVLSCFAATLAAAQDQSSDGWSNGLGGSRSSTGSIFGYEAPTASWTNVSSLASRTALSSTVTGTFSQQGSPSPSPKYTHSVPTSSSLASSMEFSPTASLTTSPPSSASPSSSGPCKSIQYPFPPGTNANDSRAQAVIDAYVRTWDAYAEYAFGNDQLQPLNRSFTNPWNHWGVTIVDGMDTAIVMNLTDIVTQQLAFIPTIDFT